MYDNVPLILLLVVSSLNCYLVASFSSQTCQSFKKTYGFKLSSHSENNNNQCDEISKRTSIEIKIPRHYPHKKSKIHQKKYPSKLHSIYVHPVLKPEQAHHALFLAKEYARKSQCWSRKDSDRHVSYSTVDFPIEDCADLEEYLEKLEFEQGMIQLLSEKYDIPVSALSFQDLFCVHYQAEDDDSVSESMTMDRLAPHRDGSLLSFTMVLSDEHQYEGGGTIFEALRDVDPHKHPEYEGNLKDGGVIRVQNPGDAVLHSGKIFHGGHIVAAGERTVIVGFVDVDNWCLRPGVLADACKGFGRLDTALNRLRRQLKKEQRDVKGEDIANGGWTRPLYFPAATSNTPDSGMRFVPAFTSVHRRGHREYQRQMRVEIEDILLREICLSQDERDKTSEIEELESFGDITILK